MALLRPNQPLSVFQRRVNIGVQLLLSLAGIAFGLWNAKNCASITTGYAAGYDFAAAFFIAILLCLVGLPLLIYWRTRWFGSGLLAAGIVSYATFLGGIAVLTKLDKVAWRHEQMVSIGPDQKASAVIYFRKQVTDQQVEDFARSVLMQPAMPRHDGRDYPTFVSEYLRLLPSQANGYEAVALTFFEKSPPDKVNAYLEAIKADGRVEKVFLNTSPVSIHIDSKHP